MLSVQYINFITADAIIAIICQGLYLLATTCITGKLIPLVQRWFKHSGKKEARFHKVIFKKDYR